MLQKVTAHGTCSERSEARLCLCSTILISHLMQQLIQLDCFTTVTLQHRGHTKAIQQCPVYLLASPALGKAFDSIRYLW